MLITISGSGTSKNIIKAVQYAKRKGAAVYSFPTMKHYKCDMKQAEDRHLQLTHKIITYLSDLKS